MKPTKNNLKKVQALLEEMGYAVRYERGSFQSGYCVVEKRKVAIVNRFLDTEARINALLDILSQVPAEESAQLSAASAEWFGKIVADKDEAPPKEN